MEKLVLEDVYRGENFVRMDDVGSLYVSGLLQLFELYGIPPDAGLYICDPTDPDKRFIIKRVKEKEGLEK